MNRLWHDLRLAARSLRRTPVVSAIVLGTLALALGVNTAMFSVVDVVLLRPLPYPEQERLVSLQIRTERFGLSNHGFGDGELLALRDRSGAFDAAGLFMYGGGTLTGDGADPEEPTSLSIDLGLQEMLGLVPLLGRGFEPDDMLPGAPRVAMIGEALWQRRFGGEAGIVGRTVTINEQAYEIIGVAPPSFRFPYEGEPIQLFFPYAIDPANAGFGWGGLGVVARLAPGVDRDEANRRLEALALALADEHPDTNADRGFVAHPLVDNIVAESLRRSLLLLWLAVGFVMVLACLNATNLFLARSLARSRDIAIRAALGATRGRIVRFVLCESVLLALGAGALGLLVGQWALEGAGALGVGDLPRGHAVGLDLRVFLFALGLALLSGILYGIAPAMQAGRVDLSQVMKEDAAQATIGRRAGRLRILLTMGEVAIACALLIAAGLMIRSSVAMHSTDTGLDYAETLALVMWADVPPDAEPDWSVRFYDDVVAEVEQVAGVESVSLVSAMPWFFMFDDLTPFSIAGHPDFADGELAKVRIRLVSENYLDAMGVTMLAGRGLSRSDDLASSGAAVVSRTFAETYFPDEDAIGRTILLSSESVPAEIVGVAADVRERRPDLEPTPVVYISHRQSPRMQMTVIAHVAGDPRALERAVTGAVWKVAPTQGIWRTTTLEQVYLEATARDRLYLRLLVAFALVAVLLAAAGIYGLVSHAVVRRTREFGIRLALGAQRREILLDVLRRGLRMAAAGIVAGLPLAWFIGRLLGGLLYGVEPIDPWTYGSVAVLVFGVTLVASLVPALRATRVPPSLALRAE